MKRIVVKIGSNVLTRKDGTLDITRMSAITDQVATLTKKGLELIVVSSGAVASGRSEINPGKDLDDVSSRQLFSAVGQVRLINRYYDLFRCHGLVCGQVLTTKDSLSRPGQYENQQHCIEVMLSNGVVPIINENDTISLTELMFTDNDELSGTMARMMKADMLLILSNINGLYSGDPTEAGSSLIPLVEVGESGTDLSECISATKSSAGRGGMKTKCGVALQLASEGIPVVIANGKIENVLLDIIDGKSDVPCTRFVKKDKR